MAQLQKNAKTAFAAKDTNDLKDDDQIAVQGGALLRVSEMDAFGGEQ